MKVREGRERGAVERGRGERKESATEKEMERDTAKGGEETGRDLLQKENPTGRPNQCPQASVTRAGCRLGEGPRDHHSGWGGPFAWVHTHPTPPPHQGKTRARRGACSLFISLLSLIFIKKF